MALGLRIGGSAGNPNLRYDKESGYIQAKNIAGSWVNMISCGSLPLSEIDLNILDSTMFEGFSTGGTYVTSSSTNPISINTWKSSTGVSIAGLRTKSFYDLSGISKLTFTYTACSYRSEIYLFDESDNKINLYSEGTYTYNGNFHTCSDVIDLSNIKGNYKIGLGCGMYYCDSNQTTGMIRVTKLLLSSS